MKKVESVVERWVYQRISRRYAQCAQALIDSINKLPLPGPARTTMKSMKSEG